MTHIFKKQQQQPTVFCIETWCVYRVNNVGIWSQER